jgi:sodium/hydrogen exchanger-like protein 6/7/sodium/hydrogen exchanger 8
VQGRLTSTTTFDFMAYIAEGFVFAYLGLTFYSYREQPWSWGLIGIMLCAILLGRGCGVFALMGTLKLFGYEKNDENRLTWSELLFIWFAGLIRGAIAFGLVLRIDNNDALFPNRMVVTTTCLTLVLFTTIFFGSTVGLLGACMFKEPKAAPNSEGQQAIFHPNIEESKEKLIDNDMNKMAVHTLASHSVKPESEKGCFERFEEKYMKSWFIHNYSKANAWNAILIHNAFMEEDKLYTKVVKKNAIKTENEKIHEQKEQIKNIELESNSARAVDNVDADKDHFTPGTN